MTTVLIADHQPHIVLTLRHLVQSTGRAVAITAGNGSQAVQLALSHRPALVMMGIELPELDGYTACRVIRDGWGDHPGQIWFITARDHAADMDQAQQVGANRVIHKPFDPDQLVTDVGAVLDQFVMRLPLSA